MPFPFLAIAISAAFTILGQLLAPKPKQKATSLAEFQVPTATEDRPKPMWVGTVRHTSPNCTWYGDYSAKAIKKGGLMTMGMKVTTGYKYYLGFDLNLGWGQMDELIKIRMNDKVAWTGSIASGTITIDNDKLFGGENEGQNNGGFVGKLTVYNGNGTQTADAYLTTKSGETPAYKKDVHIVFADANGTKGAYVGNTAAIPEMSFDVRRCPNQLAVTGNKHIIDTYDANPVCALYEFMTRSQTEFGAGFAASQFNLTNWRTAAETCYTEGLGISRMFDSSSDVETVINEYLQLIDGVINVNMTTGKFEIVLARADYDPDTILELGDDDVVEVVSHKSGSWVETYNEVKLTYIDRTQEFESIPVAAQDGANSSGLLEVRSTTVQVLGLSNPTMANKVNFRELRVQSTPLATLTIRVTRKAFELYGGAVFKWVGSQYGVSGKVFRVTEVDTGTLDNGVIEIKGVQDVFSLGSTTFNPPTTSGWTSPTTTASVITTQRLIEQPRALHAGTYDKRVMSIAKQPNSAQQSYNLFTKESTASDYTQKLSDVPFTPTGTLLNSYTSTTLNSLSQFIVVVDSLMEDLPTAVSAESIALGGGLILVNNEILGYESYTIDGSGRYVFNNVHGAQMDTVLATHTAGDRVWFISEGAGLDDASYPGGTTINAKLASQGSDGQVALASCTAISVTLGTATEPVTIGDQTTTNTPGATPNQVPVSNGDGTVTWVTITQQSRTTVSVTTSSLLHTAQESVSVALGKAYEIEKIETDFAARVRVYRSAGYRTADAGRAVGTFPTGEHGVIVDVLTDITNLALDLAPTVHGSDVGGGSSASVLVDNASGATHAITVTFTIRKKDA
jgi:hypothetical protein